MGKSGHIARKIAATMASTGTPSQFVHPAEASHGDLGMITGGDAVICLSNSGETPELNDLVAHAKRFEIPLIAIVGRANSTLAQAADIALVLPNAPEACTLGLAPTTSTTMMLALGDALAVALLERKGFTADDFQVLHPGGKLGKALIKVSDIMHTGEEVPLVPLGTGMRDAILVMTAKTFGCVGIADRAGKLTGVITDGDLRRHIDGDLFAQTVDQVMTRAPKTIRPNALAAEALGRMKASKVTALFVVAEGRPLGILRIHDILRAGVV
jgi:arabinose-5-phosphate isomerase